MCVCVYIYIYIYMKFCAQIAAACLILLRLKPKWATPDDLTRTWVHSTHSCEDKVNHNVQLSGMHVPVRIYVHACEHTYIHTHTHQNPDKFIHTGQDACWFPPLRTRQILIFARFSTAAQSTAACCAIRREVPVCCGDLTFWCSDSGFCWGVMLLFMVAIQENLKLVCRD